MKNYLRILLTALAIAVLLAAPGWLGTLRAQDAGKAAPAPAPAADAVPATPPADVEVAPGDRISADNNVTFPVDT